MSKKVGLFGRNLKVRNGFGVIVAIEFLGGYYGSRAAIWRSKCRFWTKTDRLSPVNLPRVACGDPETRGFWGGGL
jgi:hypothetical protein